MLFNSYIFILLFLPLCLIGYFSLNRLGLFNLGQGFLLGMSLLFYGYFNPNYLLIILASIVVNYLITCVMERMASSPVRKVLLSTALVFNLGILFYYKYFDFFLMNVNLLARTEFTLRKILLPLGISFFTFQQISYVVDAYRGEVPHYRFLQYASFVAYFPQLIAGPIVTHDELVPQFLDPNRKQFDWDNFAKGLFMFTLGLSKKVLIADTFGVAANWGFGTPDALDTTNALLVSLAYTIQIYFDFSGYCDMAIGIGKMMNIDLPINFDSPYKATTILEFWQRWHKTLTRFFTKYIYIPLGGNRRGAVRTYCNILIVFLVSGLWHGANWGFVLWGFLHGVFNVITRYFKPRLTGISCALSWIITFVFLDLTWILFRCETLSSASAFFGRILTWNFGPVDMQLHSAFLLPELEFVFSHVPFLHVMYLYPWLLPAVCFLGAMGLILIPKNSSWHMEHFQPKVVSLIAGSVLLAWCIMSFSGVSTFLYFNF